jgi:type IV pilus assembly protein PilC
MPFYKFKAHDKRSNKEISDTIEAATQADAIQGIKRLGYLPIEVREDRAKSAKATVAGRNGGGGSFLGGRIKPKAITLFTRQLSTLQDAGLPVVQSLRILSDMQRPGRFKLSLATVTEEVQSGAQLSESLSHFPKIWDKLYTNLVKAGETAGALDLILRRLADFREKAERLQRKVIGALVYPIAVTVIATAILSAIMIFIIPKFEKIFDDMGIKLPAMTQFLIDLSRFLGNYWWVILGSLAILFVGIRLFRATERGGNIIDRLSMMVPVLGNVVKKGSVARFTRTLGTLVTSGVGFLDALDITKAATPNIVVRNAVQAVRDSVKEGETINEPLQRSGVFDDIVVNMIKVGEETGELDKMLIKIADNYDEEVDAAVAAMMALMEPLLIVFMGAAVGFIVIALFLPLIKLITTMSATAGG